MIFTGYSLNRRGYSTLILIIFLKKTVAGGFSGPKRESSGGRRDQGGGTGDAAVRGTFLPVVKARAQDEMRRMSFRSRSSLRLFSIPSRMPTTRALLDRLATDVRLRRICGWERKSAAPSESVFSRAFAEFGGRHVRVRSAPKVMCHCMFGVLALTADQLARLVT